MKLWLLILEVVSAFAVLQNCPMGKIKSIIIRATEATKDPAIQMQMIRRIMDDIFGGSWGVLVIKNPALVSSEIHWTIPEHKNADESSAFCLAVIKGWQYNVFKTGSKDYLDRVTVNSVINRIRQTDGKQLPRRMTVKQFDELLANAIHFDKVH